MARPGHFGKWLRVAALAALFAAFGEHADACSPASDDGAANALLYRVSAVIDGETLKLDDGAEIRLLSVQPPQLTLAREEKAALAALALGTNVCLAPEEAPRDRYGRRLAHVFVSARLPEKTPDLWVQGALVERGLARVATRKESRVCAAELLGIEAKARAAKLGLWGFAAYAVRSVDTIPPQDVGTFQLVEGTVRDVAKVGGRTYLNFGPDWRTDFTVTIEARDRKLFPSGALEPEALRGRKIRVRGWVERLNGPMIAATHPEQIENLP
jgi:endonuclease YncB( thermonuclease family)